MGMGNEIDIHTAHFHGHSFDYKVTGPFHSFLALLRMKAMSNTKDCNLQWKVMCYNIKQDL